MTVIALSDSNKYSGLPGGCSEDPSELRGRDRQRAIAITSGRHKSKQTDREDVKVLLKPSILQKFGKLEVMERDIG